METNENKNKTAQNLWNTTEASLKAKYTAIQADLKKQDPK